MKNKNILNLTEMLENCDDYFSYNIEIQEDKISFNISFHTNEIREKFNEIYNESVMDDWMTDLIVNEFEYMEQKVPEFSNLRWETTFDEMRGIYAEDAIYSIKN